MQTTPQWARSSTLIAIMASVAILATAGAQDLKDSPRSPIKLAPDIRMQTILYEAEQLAAGRAADEFQTLQRELRDREITLSDDGKVHTEIIGPEGAAPLAAELIERVGGDITNTWRNRREAWVPIQRLTTLARLLPAGYFMERAHPMCYDGAVGGQGATSCNSTGYPSGNGRVIAIIDGGYQNLTAARNNGDAPTLANSTLINYTPSSFETSSPHGTGCVEAAFDHAPGATYRIYRIDSITDTGTAVTNGLANGVDVFTHSLSRYNQGWNDNTGSACAAANDAAANGALFFTSAGNRAQQHWQGFYNNSDTDDWHEWSGDDTINITVQPGGSASYWLQWNTAGGTYDYDLYLYANNLSTILASSTNGGNTYESFSWTNGGASAVTVHLAVLRVSGGVTEFELFTHDGGGTGNYQYQTAANSTTSPSNSSNANVISVGAVTWSLHSSGDGATGIIANYSSQGPSNSGLIKPDLAGPTDTTTTAYGGGFGGTSCATPNSAGAAAAFWSAHSGYDSNAIRWLLFEQANLFKDWGANGNDNIYGYGGVMLTDYVLNTRWLARGYNNVGNLSTGPYYTLSGAYAGVPTNGRILVWTGSYPETATLDTTKPCTVDVIGGSATFGN